MSEIELKYALKTDFGTITEYSGNEITFADDLNLKFVIILPEQYSQTDTYYLKLVNGNIKKRLLLDKLSYIIPLKDFITGNIKVTVEQVLKDKIIKTWKCESVILKEDNTDTSTIVEIVPELTDLKSRLSDCEKAISQLNTYIKNTGSIL